MEENTDEQNIPENYEVPNIEGEIDTVGEEIEFLEKKRKIPVVIWVALIIIISIIALVLTMNQSPTLTF